MDILSCIRTCIHNRLTQSGRVFFRPAALKILAIHQVLTADLCLAGRKNPSPCLHHPIMNTGSYFLTMAGEKYLGVCSRRRAVRILVFFVKKFWGGAQNVLTFRDGYDKIILVAWASGE
jgi:hypothetical protein